MIRLKKSVLIVEDDRWVAENYHRILQRAGFDCSVAYSAEPALEMLDKMRPHVIVLDFLLPEVNAMQLLHELQSYDDTRNLPVILCTGVEETAEHAAVLEKYGVRMVLDKASVTPPQLISAVTDVLV